MFDGPKDVPFFVAKASWLLLNLDHPSKGTKHPRISVLSQNFHFFKLRKWFILKPKMMAKTSSRLYIHELIGHRELKK